MRPLRVVFAVVCSEASFCFSGSSVSSMYAGFNLSFDMFTVRPLMLSLNIFSPLFRTVYGPSYGGFNAPVATLCLTKTCCVVSRSLWVKIALWPCLFTTGWRFLIIFVRRATKSSSPGLSGWISPKNCPDKRIVSVHHFRWCSLQVLLPCGPDSE